MAIDLTDEFAKGLPDAVIAAASLAAAWLVGHRVSVHWNLRQKERELDLDAVQKFYSTYGEFFAVWKIWSSFPHDETGRVTAPGDQRRSLLERAAAMEGALETFLVKLAVERQLDDRAKSVLARFREGLQCLRESIERDLTLRTRASGATGQEWKAQGGKNRTPGYAYAALKSLAGEVALIATAVPHRSSDERARVASDVTALTTSARYRHGWWDDTAYARTGLPDAVPDGEGVASPSDSR